MAFDEFKYRVMMGILDMAGQGVSSILLKPNHEEEAKIRSQYYSEAKGVARQDEEKRKKIIQHVTAPPVPQPIITEKKDLTTEKIEEGTACLPCSRDHFSTVSGALSEAIRFSRKEGITHPEVARRLGMSLDELNMLERIDLAPEEIVRLKGQEKQLAGWGLDKSRELRHKITTVQTHEDLERVAADAASVRTEFMRKLWSVVTVDGSISKLCKGLKDDEYKRCVTTINTVLKDKEEVPP